MNISIPLSLIASPVLSMVLYWNSLHGGLIFDDHDVMGKLRTFKWTWKWWSTASRPLTVFSYAVTAAWPNTFRSVHVVNVLLHSLNGFVVERLALIFGASPFQAFLICLLFIAHPFAVNCVAYITGRAAILSALFGFLAALAVLSDMAWLALPLIGLSVISKEDGIAFVPLVLALAWMNGYQWLVAMVLLCVIVWIKGQRQLLVTLMSGTGDKGMRRIGLPLSIPQPWHGYTVFTETMIRLPFWFVGAKQSPYHGSGMKVPPFSRFLLAMLVSLACLAVFWFQPIPTLFVLVGPWLVYIIARVPDQLMEYRNYAMTAGFSLLFLSTSPFLLIPLILVLGSIALLRAQAWRGPDTFWEAATREFSGDPSRAWQELGACFKLKGDSPNAERCFRKAIELNPQLGPAMNNLAWVLTDQGRIDEGIAMMEQCVERCPEYALAWEELGVLYERVGRDATHCYKKALDCDPLGDRPANRMGIVEFHRKNLERAAQWFDVALRMRPDHFEYIYNRAVVFRVSGKEQESQALFRRLPQPLPLTNDMIHPKAFQAC